MRIGFWFDLFHEIGHILKHGKKECFFDFKDEGAVSNDRKEKEANTFAERCLIADFKKIKDELLKYDDFEKGIVDVARKIKRSPAILAGRIAHEAEKENRSMYRVMSNFFKNKIEYYNIPMVKDAGKMVYERA